ncbi:MAG: tetratricopeptide repeat protein, partial [Myxococcota bacterium]
CLIVLDGFEGVSGGADAVERWVHATTATFLVTSRVRVASRAEQVVALGPLTSPDAARLFVARARAAGGQVDDDDPAIPELVELLDAHPLALELAAARTGVLSPKGLVSRMTDRVRLLVAPRGSHTAHRWATLRAVLDWSWSALADDERAALLELSVFAGGFELPAAEQVLAPAGGWAIDLVQALVHASLVRTLGDGRFELLHSVREFAREQAAADPARDRAAKDRHAAWFARLGADEALEALELRADHRRALQRELPNLTAACADAIARGEAEVAARTAMAAWHAVWLTGPPTAGVLLLEGALAAGPDPFTAARLRLHAGMAHLLAGDPRAARAHTEASRDGFRSPRWLALAIGQLGVLDHRDGNLDVALTSYQRALALTREVGNRAHEGSLLRNIALIAATRGQVDEAVHTLSRALELHLAAGDVRNAALTRTALAWRLVSIHALESAEDQLRDALEAFREIGDRRHVGLTLGELGVVAYLRGDLDRAFTSCTEALATHRAVGDRRNVGQELGTLASLALARGDTERAEQWLDQALVSHRSIGARGLEARDRTNLAGMRLRAGDPAGARRAAEQALELACAVGNRTIEGEVCLVLASIARIDGDLTEGRRWHGRASGLASGLPELTGAVACADGELAWAEGRLDAAREALTRGIRDARDPAQRAAALGRLAAVERSRGDLDAAERAAAAHEQAAGALRAGPRSSARWVG